MKDMTTLKENAKPNWDSAMKKMPLEMSLAGRMLFKQ
jgi:hypothetical protein